MSDRPLEFGINLNNREPLIAPDYNVPLLLDLSHSTDPDGNRLLNEAKKVLLDPSLVVPGNGFLPGFLFQYLAVFQ